ncbi:MAG: hypothetical protein KGL39_53675 [Patescibacteria group bacterium]|nr:hypothetical protein [Patescibacteria group bacterium]
MTERTGSVQAFAEADYIPGVKDRYGIADLCARPSCGAPKAWHTNKSTVGEIRPFLMKGHPGHALVWTREDGSCMGAQCNCPSYLPPEPPKPERKAYVVESDMGREFQGKWYIGFGIPAVRLADYLAEHPQSPPDPDPQCAHLSKDGVLAPASINYDLSRQVWRCLACGGLFGPDPQPAPALCICGGREDEHDEDGRCGHWGAFMNAGQCVVRTQCQCYEYRPEAQPC